MRDVNFPPSRRSFVALGVCQSSDAVAHFVMCSGSFQHAHTFSIGALTDVSTVMGVLSGIYLVGRKMEFFANVITTLPFEENSRSVLSLSQAFHAGVV